MQMRPSTCRRVRARLALAIATALLATATPAAAADLGRAAARDVPGLPACTDAGVLSTIMDRFAWGSAHVEKRSLALVGFRDIREVKLEVNGTSLYAQRWCAARVALDDGTRSTVTYRIDRAAGFAAPGYLDRPDDVEFCVAGHDPWFVHDGTCRTTRRWW